MSRYSKSDYINREMAADSIVIECDGVTLEQARQAIKDCPSADVVEVVRCKNCKYLKPFTSQYGAGQFCECPCSFGGQGVKKPDDYCSYGERRDDEEYKDSIVNARKGEE